MMTTARFRSFLLTVIDLHHDRRLGRSGGVRLTPAFAGWTPSRMQGPSTRQPPSLQRS